MYQSRMTALESEDETEEAVVSGRCGDSEALLLVPEHAVALRTASTSPAEARSFISLNLQPLRDGSVNAIERSDAAAGWVRDRQQ